MRSSDGLNPKCLNTNGPARMALGAAAVLTLAGCDLGVTDPDVITPPQAEGPDAVPVVTQGVIGAFQEAFDGYVRFSGLLTDEFIAAGTFTTHAEVDDRQINVSNSSVTGFTDTGDGGTTGDGLYQPLQTALAAADDAAENFVGSLDDPAFEDVLPALRSGIAVGKYYGAYTRMLLSELYCASVVDLGPALSSEDRMAEALALFEEAEAAAREAEEGNLAAASLMGRARAHLWLGEHEQAAAVASEVPEGFLHVAEYSSNSADQENEIFQFTTGETTGLRWTVGDGSNSFRFNESWAYFDEWVERGLIDPDSELEAFDDRIPVRLQLRYVSLDDDVPLASDYEARMIEAENEIRSGSPAAAEGIVNPLLAERGFDPASFTGDLQNDLRELARARAVGLWLTGERQATLRRFLRDGVNLYPPEKSGTDISFPIPQQELDNNPNLSPGAPCPFGDRREENV